jgi:hypothetical protein
VNTNDRSIVPLRFPPETGAVHVPRKPDGGILVYLLAPATRPHTVVFGRHYRVSLTMDGVVKKVEPLSRGESEASLEPPSGGKVKPIAVASSTPYPLETHVVASLVADRAIYVTTARGLWFVDHDSIAFVSEKVPQGLKHLSPL